MRKKQKKRGSRWSATRREMKGEELMIIVLKPGLARWVDLGPGLPEVETGSGL